MKFTCSKKELLSVLSQVSRAIAIKPQTQVLSGVYLSVKDDELEVHANNYSLGMAAKISVSAQEPGETVVLGKKFIDVVKAMPNDAILIIHNKEENYLDVASGRSKYSIPTISPEDFPKVAHKDAESRLKIKAVTLKKLIDQTVFACSKDEGHPIYNGCLLETKDDVITFVATNMHRLSIARDKLYEATDPLRFVVPADALRSTAEMLPDDEDAYIEIDYTGKGVAFTIGRVFLQARIIEGNFPDYNKVIPRASETIVRLNVAEMREAVDRIAIISKEDINKKISFFFSEEGLEISAASAEFGSGEETIDIEIEGPELDISFNYMYISDVLRTLKSDTCRIAMKGHYDPIDVREKEGAEDYIYIVTPVRT